MKYHKLMSATITLLITGNFRSADFSEWIVHRAAKLNLSGWVKPHNDQFIEIFVCGDQTLIDALEVACSLGPIDAQVHTIAKKPAISTVLPSRQSARFVRY